MQQQNEDDIQA